MLYRGEKLALAEFLPLEQANWITCGNALRLDWRTICPPTGTDVEVRGHDLSSAPVEALEVEFVNPGGETFICGNPPYKGSKWQTPEQKADLLIAWKRFPHLAKITDYVTGWIGKCVDYLVDIAGTSASFVATNSVCQGQHAAEVWPSLMAAGMEFRFAHLPFKWSNLASNKAGVTVVILGLGLKSSSTKKLFDAGQVRECSVIGPYLVADRQDVISKQTAPISNLSTMLFGNMPRDGGHLFLSREEAILLRSDSKTRTVVRRFVGSEELIYGKERYCLWIDDDNISAVEDNEIIANKLAAVKRNRLQSPAKSTRDFATRPYRFVQIAGVAGKATVVVPRVSSEDREYLPVDYLTDEFIIGDRNFAMYDAPLWHFSIVASKLHWNWIGTVCVRLEMRFSYSNTLGWNTFPVPTLTEQNKTDLTRCAEDILLARDAHFPATIADLYDPEAMPEDLRAAHDRNDETIERIYIGRRFRNNTERLEKLFQLYTEMTAKRASAAGPKKGPGRKRKGADE